MTESHVCNDTEHEAGWGLGTANHTVPGGLTGSRLDGQEAGRLKEFDSYSAKCGGMQVRLCKSTQNQMRISERWPQVSVTRK